MTDTPPGLSRYPDSGHGARTQPYPPRIFGAADFPFFFPFFASSSMRRAASTSRTCGRYAVGPGRSRTPTPIPARPQSRRRRSKHEQGGWPTPPLSGM